MSDVAQILGLAPGATNAAANELEQLKPSGTPVGGAAKASKPKGKAKKLTGMQREVLELLESNHRVSHALYPGFSKPSLQQQWKEHKSPAVKWTRKAFRNPARREFAGESDSNGLELSHWVKAHVDAPEYVFARFNVQCNVTTFTDEEYAKALATHHDVLMKWTKQETDVLFKFCARYDLRWIVIADKYNTHPIAKGAFRSVEDIKYRYYEVTRLLAEYRAKQGGDETTKAEPADSAATSDDGLAAANQYYRFNIAYERQRKRQLELAFTRSIEEENEVRKLNDELRSVEQQLKKVAVKVDTKKKKELSDVPFHVQREYPVGVFLRSSTLALPSGKQALSAKMVKKMDVLLEELGVPTRPMPTKAACDVFDKLRQDAVGLLSLRKHLAAKQAEVQSLKERYQSLTGQEYKPMATPVRRPESQRRDSTTPASLVGSTTNSPAPVSQGKALKHSEKAFRSTKKRSSGASPAIPSKRNKKNL
ncbi:TPA: hypothetical protein N0F65_012548 [Lagenidium giganteum]|uniref:Myb-like domain-containing protein n=1 Tax=Lagenidium giganteum TaxID=4803 RepID=A0AAV2YMN2_9STRA|nr:TPA: hypothetical protein N0F65_012548 [Lagenidium giganteum]